MMTAYTRIRSVWFRGFGIVRQESLDDFNIKKEKLGELKARFFDSKQGFVKHKKQMVLFCCLLWKRNKKEK